MKGTFVFGFLFLLIFTIICDSAQSKSLVTSAITSVIKNYFVENLPKIDIVIYGEVNGASERLLKEILSEEVEGISANILSGSNESRNKLQLNGSSIVLFDSKEKFKELFKKIIWLSNPRKRFKHLVHIINAEASDINLNIQDGSVIDSVDFLVQDSQNSVQLFSVFMFTQKSCRQHQLLPINSFNQSSMSWKSSIFYPNKYKNLHNCSLEVFTTNYNKVVDKTAPIPTIKKVMMILSESYNFRINYSIHHNARNATHGKFDLSETTYENFNGDETVSSTTILSEEFLYVIPPGEPYTLLEQMFLMFDLELWVAIAVTLAMALIAVQFINVMSRKIQNFIYGRGVRTPTLNLLNIFLNGGQHRVPTRNFSRFLLVLFVTWSLIIRTCYQSLLFQYLQADLRKPMIRTVEDLVSKNFTRYIYDYDLGSEAVLSETVKKR